MISKFITMCALMATSVSARSWAESTVGSMTIWSNVPDDGEYDKVVIVLHDGGSEPKNMRNYFNKGKFGRAQKIKFIAPKSTHDDYNWYKFTKSDGCGLDDDCAYDLTTISTSGDQLLAVIEAEKTLKGWTNSDKIFVAGKGQGGGMSIYLQLIKMSEKLGGVVVLKGYPIPPLAKMSEQ